MSSNDIIEKLIDLMFIPDIYDDGREKMRAAIKAALIAPAEREPLRVHVCNKVINRGVIEDYLDWLLVASYEDGNAEATEKALDFFDRLDQIVPGAFVLVDTGDYIMPRCGDNGTAYHHKERFDCDVYDPHFNYFMFPRDLWEQHADEIMRLDAEWREAAGKCKLPTTENEAAE